MRFFLGAGRDLGTVSASSHATFADLCHALASPVRLKLTRAQYHALPPKERQTVKRVAYIVPAAFGTTPSPRKTGDAVTCNLLALDVDDSREAARLIEQGWEGLGELGFIVWHTASSTPEEPRLRVLVSAEAIPPAQYGPAVRSIAELLGLAHVTRESLVCVQPMFWPTAFQPDGVDDDLPPVIASQPDGEPFAVSDIIDASEASIVLPSDEESPASDGMVADLTHLKAPMEGVTLADVAGAMEKLDPDMPMQQWIEMAAALKHQFAGKDEQAAYELWDTWSAKGKKYVDSAETEYRWRSLKAQTTDRAPVTIRSLFKLAAARGWVNQTLAKRSYSDTMAWIVNDSRTTEELLDTATARIARVAPMIGVLERKSLIGALKKKYDSRGIPLSIPDIRKEVRKLEVETAKATGVPPWAKGLCFVTSGNFFYRYTTDRRFAPEVIDLLYTLPPSGDDAAPMRARDYLIQIAGVQQVENLRYDPAKGGQRFFTDENVPYVNIYRAPALSPDEDGAAAAGEMLQRHLAHLIREEVYQKTVLDFMAYHVQHPGKKIRWAILIQGVKGCGKTFLSEVMKVVLGRRNTSKLAGAGILEGNFNDWAYGRQLVTVEEVRVIGTNRHAVMDKMKPCITDDEIDLHRKHESRQTVPNVTNYLMFTNYHDALAVDDTERRYFVLQSPLQTVEDVATMGGPAYFSSLFGMLRDNPGGLLSFLRTWPIDYGRFQPEGRAPDTPYLHELVRNAASPLASAVQQAIDDQPHALLMKDILSMNVLRDVLESERHMAAFSDQALAAVLHELGWTKAGRATIKGRRHQVWQRGFVGDASREAALREECL